MMPFTGPPWRSYEPGDLIYGMAGDGTGRNVLIEQLKAQGKLSDIYTIDQYELIQGSGAQKPAMTFDQDFIDALENSAKTWDMLYLVNGLNVDVHDQSLWELDYETATNVAKRKCKAGLEYIIVKTPYHVHFCLEGLNQERVATKSYVGRTGILKDVGSQRDGTLWFQKKRFITGAELRWVYRNRLRAEVSSKIQFWDHEPAVQCGAPWISQEGERQWSQWYQPNNVPV